jgi:hypothetical protein
MLPPDLVAARLSARCESDNRYQLNELIHRLPNDLRFYCRACGGAVQFLAVNHTSRRADAPTPAQQQALVR